MYNKDTYQFYVGQGKKITPVVVHLDYEEEPNQQEVVDELVRYISAFEEITRTCA